MAWLAANGFWVLTFIAFIAMHMFCHGGHHGHGGHDSGDHPGSKGENENGELQGRVAGGSSGEHQH